MKPYMQINWKFFHILFVLVIRSTFMIIRWRHNLMIDSMNANAIAIARGGFLFPFHCSLPSQRCLCWHKSKQLRKSSSNVGDIVGGSGGGVAKKASEKYANSRSIAIQLEAISARARMYRVSASLRVCVCVHRYRYSARDTADWHAIDYIVRAQLRQDAMRYDAMWWEEFKWVGSRRGWGGLNTRKEWRIAWFAVQQSSHSSFTFTQKKYLIRRAATRQRAA